MEHGSRPGRCPPADGTQWRGWWGSLSILSPSSCPLKPCSLCSSREGGSAGLSLSLHQGEPLQLPLTRNQLSSAIHSLQRRPGLLFSSGARASKPGNCILPAAIEPRSHGALAEPRRAQTARLCTLQALWRQILCAPLHVHTRVRAPLAKSHLSVLHGPSHQASEGESRSVPLSLLLCGPCARWTGASL